MTKGSLITKARLYVGDTSDLSDAEISDLFDKVYNDVWTDRPWEFAKSNYVGVQSTTVPYVALPANFAYIIPNASYTENSYYAERPTVLVGTNRRIVKVISYSDRNQYVNDSGYCYVDYANQRLVFCLQPTSAESVSYDYVAFPTALTLTDSPAFPAAYHDVIYHGMVADDFLMQLFDKARSYRDENMKAYDKYITKMASWNASMLQQN